MKTKDLHSLMPELAHNGKRIFLSDLVLTYTYNKTVEGVKTRGEIVMTPVAASSFQWYNPDEQQQLLTFLRKFFLTQRSLVLKQLPECRTIDQLDAFSEQLHAAMLDEYLVFPFVKRHRAKSFNRTRNLIDLYIEHLVAMAEELVSLRSQLVPLLFLPLTSQIFASGVFSSDELGEAHVKKGSTFGDLTLKADYQFLQQTALEKAQRFDPSFPRIYFDLLWKGRDKNRRYQEPGFNLYEIS